MAKSQNEDEKNEEMWLHKNNQLNSWANTLINFFSINVLKTVLSTAIAYGSQTYFETQTTLWNSESYIKCKCQKNQVQSESPKRV